MPKFKSANEFSKNFKNRSPFQATDKAFSERLKVKRGGKLDRKNYLEDLISEEAGEAVKEDDNLNDDERTELEELRNLLHEYPIGDTDDVYETFEQSQE